MIQLGWPSSVNSYPKSMQYILSGDNKIPRFTWTDFPEFQDV
jgi:hypothetical protein